HVSATADDKVYDGNASAAAHLTTDKVSSDAFTANYTSATFSDKNVGNGKTVTVNGISITGGDAGNYNLVNNTTTTTANITKPQLTVTANSQTMLLNAAVPSLTYAITGFVGGETLGTSDVAGTPNCSTTGDGTVSGAFPITCTQNSLA